MMKAEELKTRALGWTESWNAGDIEKILDHYSDDVELYSPFVVERWKLEDGRISGKEKLRDHFLKALGTRAGSRLQLVEVLQGVKGVLFIYKNKEGVLSADQVELNDAGKVRSVKAYYTSH